MKFFRKIGSPLKFQIHGIFLSLSLEEKEKAIHLWQKRLGLTFLLDSRLIASRQPFLVICHCNSIRTCIRLFVGPSIILISTSYVPRSGYSTAISFIVVLYTRKLAPSYVCPHVSLSSSCPVSVSARLMSFGRFVRGDLYSFNVSPSLYWYHLKCVLNAKNGDSCGYFLFRRSIFTCFPPFCQLLGSCSFFHSLNGLKKKTTQQLFFTEEQESATMPVSSNFLCMGWLFHPVAHWLRIPRGNRLNVR